MTEENVFDALFIARSFILTPLERKCAEIISDYLTIENFVAVTNEACNFDSEDIKAMCVQYFGFNSGKIMQNRETDCFSREAMAAIVNSTTLTDASEVALLQMLWRWGRYGLSKVTHLSYAGTDEVVKFWGTLRDGIQFLEMAVEDFSLYVAGKQILPMEMEIEYFRYFTAPVSKRSIGYMVPIEDSVKRNIVPLPARALQAASRTAPTKDLPHTEEIDCTQCGKRIDSSVGQEWVTCHLCPEELICLTCVVEGKHREHRMNMQLFSNEEHSSWCSLCGWDLLSGP